MPDGGRGVGTRVETTGVGLLVGYASVEIAVNVGTSSGVGDETTGELSGKRVGVLVQMAAVETMVGNGSRLEQPPIIIVANASEAIMSGLKRLDPVTGIDRMSYLLKGSENSLPQPNICVLGTFN